MNRDLFNKNEYCLSHNLRNLSKLIIFSPQNYKQNIKNNLSLFINNKPIPIVNCEKILALILLSFETAFCK